MIRPTTMLQVSVRPHIPFMHDKTTGQLSVGSRDHDVSAFELRDILVEKEKKKIHPAA
jgi:hypothetical protein